MVIKLFNQETSLKDIWRFKKSIVQIIISPKKIVNALKIYFCMLFKKDKLYGIPYSLLLEPTSKCNLACPMCARTIYPQIMNMRKNKNMEYEKFKKIMDEIGDKLIFLFLWNFGEPLMHKDLSKMIQYVKKKKIFVLVSTNAYLLNKKNSEDIIKSGLDYLIISFDGATQKSYELYRKNSDFIKVTNNIKRFVEIREQLKSKTPLINLQFILMKYNVSEITEIQKLAKELKVDRLTFKKTIVYDDNIEKELLPEDEHLKFNFYSSKQKRKTICVRPWNNFVINCEGAVLPCCDDIFYKNYMGNALESDINSILNNEKYINFRKRFIKNPETIDICRKCPRRFSKDLTLVE